MAKILSPVGQLAGLGSRIVAWLIDAIVGSFVGTLLFIPTVLFAGLLGWNGTSSEVVRTLGLLSMYLLVGLAFTGYFIVMEGMYGVTVGKKLLSIHVVGEDGGDISMGAAAIRNILRIVDILPTAYIIGVLLIAVNDHEQRVGDMAAGTYVVKG